MNYNFLNGITTALVTPFNNNKIDFEKLELVVNNQVKAKISSILLFGTTGETYSLSFSEKKSIFLAVKQFAPKMPIIAGVSHPSTDECIKDCKRMLKLGADAVMVTTPYFYKTLNIGIISHFSKIASCINLPLIAYNVPTRTGCDISSNEQILNELSKIKNLVAIKQASLNLSLCKSISNKYNFLSLCGNDSYILELLKIGYSGAISVLSNVFPERLVSVYNKVKEQTQSQEIPNSQRRTTDRRLGLSNYLPLGYVVNNQSSNAFAFLSYSFSSVGSKLKDVAH